MGLLFGWLKRVADRDLAQTPPPTLSEEPPPLVDLASIPDAFEMTEGVQHPRWDVIHRHVNAHVPAPDFDRAWREICCQWLTRLGVSLGPRYRLWTSDVLALLTGADPDIAEPLLRTASQAVRSLQSFFGPLARERALGPYALIQFRETDQYYAYVAAFEPEGEYPASGGVYLNRGYGHVALPPLPGWSLNSAVVHEFTHSVLALRPTEMPGWINEGLASVMPEFLLNEHRPPLTRERAAEHHECWSSRGLEGFWSGSVWRSPDVDFELSYELAVILIRNFLIDHRDRLAEFVERAELDDAGEQAAIDCFGESLGQRVAQFLGPGDWAPRAGYALDTPPTPYPPP